MMKRKTKKILSLFMCAVIVFAGLQLTPWSKGEAKAADATHYGWHMSDNVSGDSVTITDDTNHGKVLKVTKGSGEASDWVSLTAPQIDVTGGTTYQLQFERKLDEGSSISVIYYEIIDEVHAESYNVNLTSGTVDANGWCSETGKFTVTDSAEKIEVRIYCRGASGKALCFDDFTLNPMRIVGENKVYLDQSSWEITNNTADNNTITLSDVGKEDIGSLHVQKGTAAGDTDLRITPVVTLEVGKTYVFEAWVNGTFNGDKVGINLSFGGAQVTKNLWQQDSLINLYSTESDTYNYGKEVRVSADSSDNQWIQLSGAFYREETSNGIFTISIFAPGYATCDFYIDHIKIYEQGDETKKNLLSNGDFSQYTEKEPYFDSAIAWNYDGGYKGTTTNSNETTNTITLVEEGCNGNIGSLHFKKYGGEIWEGSDIRVKNHISATPEETYVFEMSYKGQVWNGTADSNKASIYLGNVETSGKWIDGTFSADASHYYYQYNDTLNLETNTDEWTQVSAEFEAVGSLVTLEIVAPRYTWDGGMDFYIDNVKVYLKNDATKTNLLENGDFNIDKMALDTSVNLFVDGDFDDLQIAELNGTSLSLDGNIGVNFYMELNNVPATAYMQFTLPNGTIEKIAIPKTATEYGYCFTAKVAAKEMTADIKAQMFLEDGTAISDEYIYTVEDYAKVILNGEYSEETKALVKAMLRYGAYAQMYFKSSHSGTTLPNDGLEAYVDSAVAWNYTNGEYGGYMGTTTNDDSTTNTITLSEEGCNDTGSLHFEKEAKIGPTISITNHIDATPGQIYVFEMSYKGSVVSGAELSNNTRINLGNVTQFGKWIDGTFSSNVSHVYDQYNDTLYLTQDTSEWSKVAAEFEASGSEVMIQIATPQYSWYGVDFYIDNVKVYLKSDASKTNLLDNGDFYKDLIDVTIADEYQAEVTKADNIATLKSSQLVLKSETTMKVYFELAKTEGLTILVDGEAAETEINGKTCTVIINNIAAHDLDAILTITISDGTNTLTVQNSAMTYVYNVLQYSGSSDELKNVVKALYLYNLAANEYKDQ